MITPIYDEAFFDWLRSIDKLDHYEAALDISVFETDFWEYRHQAADTVQKYWETYRDLT